MEFCGSRLCQLAGRALTLSAIASMSAARASVTTSACKPSITLRAWLPEPPWLWSIVTIWPVLAFQSAANATLIAL
ncbi:hypothetical protein D3C83_91190 [compost metagenome]